VDAGFNRERLLLFRIDATSAGYDLARAADLHARIRDRVASLSGVQAATFSRVALLSRTRQNMTFAIPGQDAQPDIPMNVLTNGIDQGFLEAMEIPVLAGRGFNGHDDGRAARVGLVNQAFARTYFGEASPIGRTLEFNAPGFHHSVEVVGVVRDAKYTELRGVAPATVYFPAQQQPDGNANFAVRARGRHADMLQAIAAAVRAVDPDLPVLNFRTQDEQLERLHGQERLFARLSGLFGLSSLALACVGLYGLLSDAVARRRAEIGLRIARLVSTMLFDVSPTDPATYVSVAGALLTFALLASAFPAYRASRVEPIRALGLR
jgi:MacB-like periplasmic core domain